VVVPSGLVGTSTSKAASPSNSTRATSTAHAFVVPVAGSVVLSFV